MDKNIERLLEDLAITHEFARLFETPDDDARFIRTLYASLGQYTRPLVKTGKICYAYPHNHWEKTPKIPQLRAQNNYEKCVDEFIRYYFGSPGQAKQTMQEIATRRGKNHNLVFQDIDYVRRVITQHCLKALWYGTLGVSPEKVAALH